MPGNDHIPTAPKDVIGDDSDLREMRDALRAGKRVTLGHDGHVYVSPDAVAPMTTAQEDFIESKLGHVIEMARQGYGVSVGPDGSISAERMDHKGKVRYDMDKGFNEQERILIQTGISDGALIRLHPDGRVEYFLPNDAKPPTGEQARELQKFLDDEIASGRLADGWRNGETLAAQPDGSVVYQKVGEGPPPVEFPEEVRWGHDPLTTADQLEAEANSLELGAGAARINADQDYQDASGKAAEERDGAVRARAGADAFADQAQRQVMERQSTVARIDAEKRRIAAEAERRVDAGDAKGAEELAEQHRTLLADERLAQQQLDMAKAAADAGRAAARKAADDEATGTSGVQAATDRHGKLEDVFDSQEDQARVYRQAATEMREAERLEAAYADLQSRAVPDAERVKEAAAQHRAKAEELRTKAEAFDAPQAAPSTTDVPIPKDVKLPPRTEQERQERGPIGANEPPVDPDQPVVAAATGDPSPADANTGLDGDLTAAVAATDATGAEDEIEMPPMDLSGEVTASDLPSADPWAKDPMASEVADAGDSSVAEVSDFAEADVPPPEGTGVDDSGTETFDA